MNRSGNKKKRAAKRVELRMKSANAMEHCTKAREAVDNVAITEELRFCPVT